MKNVLLIPLILSSLISGITSIGSGSSLGRLGFKTIVYYITTSFFAILTGQILVNIFKPGVGANINFVQEVEGLVEKQKEFLDIIVEIVPSNIIQAMVNNDMLSIIFFAIIFGFFITKASKKHAATMKAFFDAVFDVMMKITMFVIKFTPLGIFGRMMRGFFFIITRMLINGKKRRRKISLLVIWKEKER